MEKTFLVKRSDGKQVEISETMAKQLGRQVEVVGEITDVGFKKRGRKEVLSPEEFRKKSVSHSEEIVNGKRVRVRNVEKGFERVLEVDKKSRPGAVKMEQGVVRDRTVVDARGQEIDRQEWERRRNQ